MLRRIANSVLLEPTRNAIPAKHKTQVALPHVGGAIDLWIERANAATTDDVELFVLKYGGTASRAERGTTHPLDFWTDVRAEVWCMNWPGFGAGEGKATITAIAPAGDAVYQELRRVAAGRPILVTGNSLGSTVALYVAAKYRNASGLLLRNPPALRQIIVGKHGWWNGWIGAWLVAQQVPRTLDAIANSRGSDVPALFVVSGRDRIVPVPYQEKVYEAYAGPKNYVLFAEADHADPPGEGDIQPYRRALDWLRWQMLAGAATPAAGGNRQGA